MSDIAPSSGRYNATHLFSNLTAKRAPRTSSAKQKNPFERWSLTCTRCVSPLTTPKHDRQSCLQRWVVDSRAVASSLSLSLSRDTTAVASAGSTSSGRRMPFGRASSATANPSQSRRTARQGPHFTGVTGSVRLNSGQRCVDSQASRSRQAASGTRALAAAAALSRGGARQGASRGCGSGNGGRRCDRGSSCGTAQPNCTRPVRC